MEKPKNVKLAVNLLYSIIIVGLISSAIDYFFYNKKEIIDAMATEDDILPISPPSFNIIFVLIVSILTFSIMYLLTCMISRGKNWARIIYLIFYIIGVIPYFSALITVFERSYLLGLLSIIQYTMQTYAFYLLFTRPGKDYFKKIKI